MTKKEALEILGLDENATKEDIINSHQKLIKSDLQPRLTRIAFSYE